MTLNLGEINDVKEKTHKTKHKTQWPICSNTQETHKSTKLESLTFTKSTLAEANL